MVYRALEAADNLAAKGASVEVVDLRSIVPMDEETVLESIAKTSRALVLYESHRFLGVGAEVAAMIAEKAFEHLDAPVERLAPRTRRCRSLPRWRMPTSRRCPTSRPPSSGSLHGDHRQAEPGGDARVTSIQMPQLGETIIEGTILKWLKQEGDTIDQTSAAR